MVDFDCVGSHCLVPKSNAFSTLSCDVVQGKAVMAQFSEGSAVISAALDIYDRDSDLAHLVQTLQDSVDAR